MHTFFPVEVHPDDVPRIRGLSYLPHYITPGEEAALVAAIDAEAWDTTWQRRRQPYGATYGPERTATAPIPVWGMRLAQRMLREGIVERQFDQMLINEYLPGQGIALHHDHAPFERTVVSLSLLSPTVMDFRRPADGNRASLLLEPRSLLVLSDEARYQWQHGIAVRKTDVWHGIKVRRARRLSVTFRLRKLAD
jgi:alkylated DNA repair dioxygenase AlkB